MKSINIIIAILAPVTIVTIVTTSTQHVYAPRGRNGCSEFKKLTNEFEKDLLDAPIGNPELIPGLLKQYNLDVLELFETPSNIPIVN
jgi:hypothetical protein